MPEKEMDMTEAMYNAAEKETDTASCPGCGANLTFNADKNVLWCEHCGNEVAFEASHAEEQSFEKLLQPQNTWGSETFVIRCNNCGAKEIIAKGEISKHCAFCGTTNIVETEELSGLKPNALLPFKLSKDAASEQVRKWAKKKIFAPKAFKESADPDKIDGVYSPAFTFDTATETNYYGVLGKHYTETRRHNGKVTTVTKTRYFTVSGSYSRYFDDVLIQSSSTISQKNIAKLGGFDTNNSKEYTKEYLRGYSAEQYSKDGLQCWEDAKGVMDKKLKSEILRRYDYDTVRSFKMSTGYSDITYKYILLPIYVGHCTFKEKLYNFFVNGFSGKVTGKSPKHPAKVSLAALLGLIVVGGIAALLLYFMGYFGG